ncbi:MAG: hypothetical protein ACI976_000164, partial [Aureispira sp.]
EQTYYFFILFIGKNLPRIIHYCQVFIFKVFQETVNK